MDKRKLKEMATSLTTIVFLVIGLTGVMIYYHWFDSHIKELHENLGLALVAIVFLHIFVNWNSMKSYFTKKTFYISTAVIMVISSTFILNSLTSTEIHPKTIVFDSVKQAPLHDLFKVLNINYEEAKTKLQSQSIDITQYKNLGELAKNNDLNVFDVVSILKSN